MAPDEQNAEAEFDRVLPGCSLEACAPNDRPGLARNDNPGTVPQSRGIRNDPGSIHAEEAGKVCIRPIIRNEGVDQRLCCLPVFKCFDEIRCKGDEVQPIRGKAR